MSPQRIGRTVAALVLALGAVTACAGDEEEPAAIDGQVDIVPADDAKTVAEKPRTGKGDLPKGSDPTSDLPKPAKDDCVESVAASNALLTEHVVALFPATALRRVEEMRPADTFNCDPAEGPDFGGVSALWKGITGAQAIAIFTEDGWKRQDPPEGEPAWARQNLKPGNGDLNYEPAEKFIVTFRAERGGRPMWVELTQDGMRAGLD
jgi:hypothetical protein